jgi:hypothetical protein
MKDLWLAAALALAMTCGSEASADSTPQASPPPKASAYDGLWDVTLTCPVADDGAKGYVYVFPARVKGGFIHGEHNAQGTAGWLTVDGPIAEDGSAVLVANGLTGKPAYSVGRVETLTPYSYHIAAQFNSGHGTGTRKELRPCSLDFKKT